MQLLDRLIWVSIYQICLLYMPHDMCIGFFICHIQICIHGTDTDLPSSHLHSNTNSLTLSPVRTRISTLGNGAESITQLLFRSVPICFSLFCVALVQPWGPVSDRWLQQLLELRRDPLRACSLIGPTVILSPPPPLTHTRVPIPESWAFPEPRTENLNLYFHPTPLFDAAPSTIHPSIHPSTIYT